MGIRTACGTQEQTLTGLCLLSVRLYPSLPCSDPRMIGSEEGRSGARSLQTALQIAVAFTALINSMGPYRLIFMTQCKGKSCLWT